MDCKFSKASRILDLYVRLCAGAVIRKEEESQNFHIDQRSVQRDIDDLRTFFAEWNAEHSTNLQLLYSREQKGFVLRGHQSTLMSNSEILAVSKILLESRAFSKKDLYTISGAIMPLCGLFPPPRIPHTAAGEIFADLFGDFLVFSQQPV